MSFSPSQKLEKIAKENGLQVNSVEFAKYMDDVDPLKEFRQKFDYPKRKTLPVNWKDKTTEELEEECIYMAGNSLGIRPKKAEHYMNLVMNQWRDQALYSHFTGILGAASCDKPGKPFMAEIVGAAYEHEITLMNSLTVNLHLMMQAFYRPTETRYKILIEDHAFPSDRYAMRSCIELQANAIKHGMEDALLIIGPRPGEKTIRTEDVIAKIEEAGDSLATVMMPGINYMTGQVFDMETITAAGHKAGAMVGWDLAHAVGNVPLQLHKWNVDFAVWCTYKYLNSGAGGVGGAFLHDRYAKCPPPHLTGWWGNKDSNRFDMADKIDLAVGCDSFRLANPPPWTACLNYASLEIFHEAKMERIFEKQFLLTGFLEFLITKYFSKTGVASDNSKLTVEIVTPSNTAERGSQLSLLFSQDLKEVHEKVEQMGVVCDMRSTIIRVAPAPLYNSFMDVWRFVEIVNKLTQ